MAALRITSHVPTEVKALMALFTLAFENAHATVLVIQMSETYGDFLEGSTERMNARVFQKSVEKADRLWPDRQALVLRPADHLPDLKLPRIQCLSLLERAGIASDDDISQIVLIHFENDVTPFSADTHHRLAYQRWPTD